MSIQTVDRPKQTPQSTKQVESPPLNSGDRLSRAEFERRYQAHPEVRKAELIEGVVYVSSPNSPDFFFSEIHHQNLSGLMGSNLS